MLSSLLRTILPSAAFAGIAGGAVYVSLAHVPHCGVLTGI